MTCHDYIAQHAIVLAQAVRHFLAREIPYRQLEDLSWQLLSHWQALPADQPSGALPPGITLDLGSPVNIAAGTSAPVNIQLTGGPGAGESGTIILKLFATERGSQPRAELRLDYRLHEARPGLTPSPTALELGVQQGKSISGKLTLTNKGYAPAQNVQVALQAVLNVAVVTNTIPNTGISLPFFSSGGTSLMMLLGEMGIVLSVSRGES